MPIYTGKEKILIEGLLDFSSKKTRDLLCLNKSTLFYPSKGVYIDLKYVRIVSGSMITPKSGYPLFDKKAML